MHLRFQVAQIHAAIHQQCAAGRGQGGQGRRVEFVFEFAGKLLDGVLGSNQADGRAVLVHNDGDVTAALLKITEEIEGAFGFRHDQDAAHHLAELELDKRRG